MGSGPSSWPRCPIPSSSRSPSPPRSGSHSRRAPRRRHPSRARAAALGIDGVAARLDDRFRLLAGGHRTAMPRHQTLRATLDWSYELLTEPERVVLRGLAIFAGGFTLEVASAVAADDDIAASE